MKKQLRWAGVVLGSLLAAGGANAQDPGEVRTRLAGDPVYNLNPPGARALGMGATFVGIADDATAAEANPAGLVILGQPEASIHYRVSDYETLAEDPFSIPFDESAAFGNRTSGVSFLSYVHPFPARRFAVSVSYQQAANYRRSESFRSESFGVRSPGESIYELDLLYEHSSFSAAVEIGSFFSIGASVRYSRFDLDLTNQFSLWVENPSDPDESAFVSLDQEFAGSDDQVTFNAGVLIDPGGRWSLGLAYEQGGDFVVDRSTFVRATFPFFPDPTTGRTPFVRDLEPPVLGETRFTVPDSYGVGVAYRPSSNWVLGIDAIRVLYSDTLVKPGSEFVNPDDETEIHAGLEYAFFVGAEDTPVFVRAGFYTNPDHDGSDVLDSEQQFVTFGAGVFLDQAFQLDGAVAVSDDNLEALVSLVWRLSRKTRGEG